MTIPDYLYFILDPDILAKYGWRFWQGFIVTIKLVSGSFVLGFILAVFIALARQSRQALLQYPARAYIYFFRGTPLLAQLFLFYYGSNSISGFWENIGLWWFVSEPWNCCILIFALNTAAYQAEILRGSMQSVPFGQYEAAQALCLAPHTRFFKVILPQAMILALRPLGNEFILMVKASAIASLVTIYDLMGVAKLAYARTYDFQVYIWAAILYLLIVEIVRRLVLLIENRITRHLHR